MRWAHRREVVVKTSRPRLPTPFWLSSIFFAEYQGLKPLRFRLSMCLSYPDSETAEYQTLPVIPTVACLDTRCANTIRSEGRTPSTTRNIRLCSPCVQSDSRITTRFRPRLGIK